MTTRVVSIVVASALLGWTACSNSPAPAPELQTILGVEELNRLDLLPRLTAVVDDATLPNVVTMPHGWWASLLPGGSSANALTPDGLSDLGGGGAFYDAKVEVERID